MGRPSKLSPEQWAEVRAKREAYGLGFAELGRQYGISHVAIGNRAAAEGWAGVEEVRRAVNSRVRQKVTGVIKEMSDAQREVAIEAEATRLAAVQLRQREDWVEAKAVVDAAKDKHRAADVYDPEDLGRPLSHEEILANAAARRLAAEDLKAAKTYAESLKIIQEGERKAWDMDANFDVEKMTDEELDRALASH